MGRQSQLDRAIANLQHEIAQHEQQIAVLHAAIVRLEQQQADERAKKGTT